MKKDAFTEKSSTGKYLVKSLYYDNHKMKAFHEKENGNFSRIKLRIRAYDDIPSDKSKINVELKTRKGELMEKFSTFIKYDNYLSLEKTNHWSNMDNSVLNEFERLIHIHNYEPKLLVAYDREGFESIDKKRLRITFDHNIRFARTKELFDQNPRYTKWPAHDIVLEIKYTGKLPWWVSQLIKDYGLKRSANSKYGQGIYNTHLDMKTTVTRRDLIDDFNSFNNLVEE